VVGMQLDSVRPETGTAEDCKKRKQKNQKTVDEDEDEDEDEEEDEKEGIEMNKDTELELSVLLCDGRKISGVTLKGTPMTKVEIRVKNDALALFNQMSTDEERNRFWTFKDWGENRRYLENKYLQSSCRSLSHHIYSVSLEGR